MIEYKTVNSTNYAIRTKANVLASDITIAFAVYLNTAGEKLTKRLTQQFHKQYTSVDTNVLNVTEELINAGIQRLNRVPCSKVNIAGNGLYTLRGLYTQEDINQYMFELLQGIFTSRELKVPIEEVYSGGQSGFDEAGAIAADDLGIPVTIISTSDWKYKDENGYTIRNEDWFKARFIF
jgi:hypothetical protein